MCIMHWWNDNDKKTEVHRESLPQCHFVHHRSYMDWPEICGGQSVRNTESLQSCLVSESMWNCIITLQRHEYKVYCTRK
jgi:hypothetical protein